MIYLPGFYYEAVFILRIFTPEQVFLIMKQFLFLELLKRFINALTTLKQLPRAEDDELKKIRHGKVKDFVGDFNKLFEDLAKRYKKMPRK